MTLPRSVADVLPDHVVFEVGCIDRMYLNVYVPGLQYPAGLVAFVHRQLGFADRLDRSTGQDQRRVQHRDAPLRPRAAGAVGGLRQGPAQGRRHARAPGRVQRAAGGAVHRPRAGEDRAVPHRAAPQCRGRGLSVDRAVDRVVNHYYVYAVDADFGPFFLKFCSYFPYTGKLCLNGHEWAKRQAVTAGIGYTAAPPRAAVSCPRRPVPRSRPGTAPAASRDLPSLWRSAPPVRSPKPGPHKLYGHIKPVKRRTEFLAFCRYPRTLYPPAARIAIVCDNFSPHLTTKKCRRVADWAEANNVDPHRAGQHDPPLHQLAGTATPTTGACAPSSTRRTLPDEALATSC
jgi:hypothetical protein